MTLPNNPLAARAAPGRLAPISTGERIHVLDVIRGFALFGVLLANMVWWFSGYSVLDREAAEGLPTAAFDPIVLNAQSFFVDSKFISIFAFLFGVGFAVQLHRASQRGVEITPVYKRRMLWLLVFGLAHMFFLWYGDILHLYAVLGLLLIGWTARSDKVFVGWGLAFAVLIPVMLQAGLSGISFITGGSLDPGVVIEARWEAVEALRLSAFKSGTYADVVRANVAEARAWFSTDDALSTGAESFGKLLLGFWVGRSGLLLRAGKGLTDRDWSIFRRGLAWGLALGVGCQGMVMVVDSYFMPVAETWSGDIALETLWHVGILGMALFYVCGMVLLFQRQAWRGRLYVFAPVGRMALTNYLGQSLICVFIFYDWGLGWYGKVGPTTCVGLTVIVFLAQAGASQWWLGRFRYGPVEWVWRCLTYGRMQSIRLKSTAEA